jgi:N-formylglutamate amidohydrolase
VTQKHRNTPEDPLMAATDALSPPFEIVRPAHPAGACVFASPHSGRRYPREFIKASRLDPVMLRRSEDAFVDELFADAPRLGAPLLKALFPRAFIDPNREAYELDPAMFDAPLPAFVNTRSPRVAGGLGTVAKLVTDGAEIYRGLLSFEEVEHRVEKLYRPYHAALAKLLEETRERCGHAVLIDCHSMPSVGGPMDRDAGRGRADFVLGDRYGSACAPGLTLFIADTLRGMGYRVMRNNPYAGGQTTEDYGRPNNGVHAIQIEINRSLYMNEEMVTRAAGLERLRADMARLAEALTRFEIVGWRAAAQ